MAFALPLGGCADAYYANNGIRSPEARYNTFYAPDYYPYSYYGPSYDTVVRSGVRYNDAYGPRY